MKGTYFRKGYGTAKKANWEKITDITNDDLVFKEFIEPRINDWKYRDEKLTDGYAWTLVSVSEIVITFLPSSEVGNAESENIDFDIGDEFVVQYPSWMINSMSGVKTTMKKTNGNNCFFMAILYAYSHKKYLSEADIIIYSKLFNWKGIDIHGTVTREQIIKWNENNPKFYLIVYLYNGLTEETRKEDFLEKFEVYIAPPNDVEGKEAIPLLLLGSQEASSLNFVINNATSITSYVSNEIKQYFKRAHIIPILDVGKLFRGKYGDNQVHYCKKCAYYFSSQKALEKHQENGCNKQYEPNISVSTKPIGFTQFDKLGELPSFIIYDTETIQKRIASGPIQYKEGKGGMLIPIVNKIPVSEGGVQSIHEAFLFPIIVWTKEEYTQFLPNSLFPNLGATIHDLERLKVVSWKLPFGGLWLFYGSDCLEKGINFLHELDINICYETQVWRKKKKRNWRMGTYYAYHYERC